MTGPKILCWDIENSPGLGEFWGNGYQCNILRIIKPSRVTSFAAKWRGDKKVIYRADYYGADGKFDPTGSKHDEMVATAWELLDQADAVISYNGARHDSPHINTEFDRVGAGPPSPYKEIDLYKVSTRRFKFQRNGLDYISNDLGIGQKIKHEGHDLWVKTSEGDEAAWRRFRRYNIQDVLLTEALYERHLPWIPRSMHPNMALYASDDNTCPKCGASGQLVRRGKAPTLVAVYPRFRCGACGEWSQGKKAVGSVGIRGAV